MSNGELMPDLQILSMSWPPPVEQQSAARSRGHGAQVNTFGDPYWSFSLQTTELSEADFRIWSSFIGRRRGRKFSFLAWRHSLRGPQAGGVASDAGLSVVDWDRAAQTVDLSGAGSYAATPGDMYGHYTAAGGYFLAEIVAAATAAGGDVTLTLNMPVLEPHPTQANPRRLDALGEFEMVSVSPPDEALATRRWAFAAEQVIRS